MKSSRIDGAGSRAGSAEAQGIVLLEDQNLYAYNQQTPVDMESDRSRPLQMQFGFPYDNTMLKAEHPTMSSRGDANSRHDFQTPFHLQTTPYATSSHGTVPSSHGAIRPGGSVDLFSRHYIGLLFNWTLIGFFDGSIAGLAQPFLKNYLGYSDSQLNAALSIFNAPRLFKCVGGFISDCFPINRQRRKPYMIIGWSGLMIFMSILAIMNEPEPEKRDGVVVDPTADSQGPKYVLLILFGLFGALLVTVSCEGLMVECSHREGVFERGRTPSWCLGVRFFAEGIGSMSSAFALNSAEFGGTFAESVPLRLIFAGYALMAALGILFSRCFIYEEQTPVTSQRLVTQFRRIWSILQKRMVSQATVIGFLVNIGFLYKIYEHNQIFKKWLGAGTLVANLPVAIVSEGKAVASALFVLFLLNANWRSILIWSVTLGLIVMVPVDVLIVYDVYRSLALGLVQNVVVAVTDGLLTIMYVLVVIEVAEPGYEAVTYGVITLVYNLGYTATSMAKNVAATKWDPSVIHLERDTSAVREHIMRELILKYALRVTTALLIFCLIPRQKRHLYVIATQSAPNLVLPVITFSFFAMLFVVSVTSNTLAIFPSTSCLVFAGGKGC